MCCHRIFNLADRGSIAIKTALIIGCTCQVQTSVISTVSSTRHRELLVAYTGIISDKTKSTVNCSISCGLNCFVLYAAGCPGPYISSCCIFEWRGCKVAFESKNIVRVAICFYLLVRAVCEIIIVDIVVEVLKIPILISINEVFNICIGTRIDLVARIVVGQGESRSSHFRPVLLFSIY